MGTAQEEILAMRIYLNWLLGNVILISVLLLTTAAPSMAAVIALHQMEHWVDAAPDIRISKAEYKAAEAKVNLAQSKLSPALFGSVIYDNYSNPTQSSSYEVNNIGSNGSVSQYNETLTSIQQRYNNIGINIGLSIPLFGSRQTLQRNVILAKSDLSQRGLNIQLNRWKAIKALRYAYAEFYIRQIQIKLAKQFLLNETHDKQILRNNNMRPGLLNWHNYLFILIAIYFF